MKIAYILNSTLPQGGATKSFLALIKEIRGNDVECIVVVPDKNGIYHDLRDLNIEVQVLNYRPAIYPWINSPSDIILFLPRLIGRITVNYNAARKLWHYLKCKNVDIVHTNVSVIDIGFRAARKLKTPHIYHIREYADKDFKMYYYPCRKHFIHQLSSRNCFNICITKDIQRHHQQQDNPRSSVIYNGIASYKQPEESFFRGDYLLFAGRIEEAKGVEFLIHAYSEYLKSHPQIALPLYLAGDIINFNLYEKLKTILLSEHIQEKVQFLGVRNDIYELMQKARAVIVTSRFEAFGRCMPEAMFRKRLTIGRNTGGTLEQMENGKRITGEDIALRFDTPSQLSERLFEATAMSDEQYRHITELAWNTVKKLYSTESYANSVLSLYKKIKTIEYDKKNN